ncbi:MAG: GDP-mannose 4,6-dehydratase [Halobacteria archaeon]
MTVLVTGGAGFVGSRICGALLDRGERVVALDNLEPFYPAVIKRGNLEELKGRRGFEFVRGDIRNTPHLRRLLRESRAGAVLHTAARPGVQASLEDPVSTFDVNARGTLSLLEAMEGSRVETVVFASSSTVYGRRGSGRRQFREEDAGAPISPYGVSKLAGEHYLRVFSGLRGFRCAALRLFTVYGPRMRPDLGIPTLVSRAVRGQTIEIYGSPVRDFTHVDDVVAGFMRALDRGSGVYNIGGGRPVSIREVARTVVRLTGSGSRIVARPPRPGDMGYTWADTSKARRELGWRPRARLERGLREYIEWFQEEGRWL